MSTLEKRLEIQANHIREKKLSMKQKLEALGVTGLSELPSFEELENAIGSLEDKLDKNFYGREDWISLILPQNIGAQTSNRKIYLNDNGVGLGTLIGNTYTNVAYVNAMIENLQQNLNRVVGLALAGGTNPVTVAFMGGLKYPEDSGDARKTGVVYGNSKFSTVNSDGLGYYSNEIKQFTECGWYMSLPNTQPTFTFVALNKTLVAGNSSINPGILVTVGKILEICNFTQMPYYTEITNNIAVYNGSGPYHGISFRMKRSIGTIPRIQ